MKDGVIDYFEEVSADMVTAIKTNEWNKFALQKPYKMEIGHGYAFGLYYTHTAKATRWRRQHRGNRGEGQQLLNLKSVFKGLCRVEVHTGRHCLKARCRATSCCQQT